MNNQLPTSETLPEREILPGTVAVNIHGQEIALDSGSQELFDMLAENLRPGTPIMIELQGGKAELKSTEQNKKVLFLSDGTFNQTNELRAPQHTHGSTLALLGQNGLYTLVHRTGNLIMPASALKKNVIKSIYIDETSLLPNIEAVRALMFTENALYIDPSEYNVSGQETDLSVTTELIRTICTAAIKAGIIVLDHKGKKCPEPERTVDFKQVNNLSNGNEVISINDILVYESRPGGRDIGFIKFDQKGSAFFLPVRNMRKYMIQAFHQNFINETLCISGVM